MTDPRGILLLDKPSGPTSHDVVAMVRRGSGTRRVGHAGTLDPMATGLLVVCIGTATRLSEYLAGKDKRYLARVSFGKSTTTYDALGESVQEFGGALPDRAEIEAALSAFRGRQQQVPPQFSAIKRGGQKAYEAARRGEHLALEARAVEFYAIDLLAWDPPVLELDVHCSAGTYIRSLAHDLGQQLACGGHLAGLRRTASGSLPLTEALTLDALQIEFDRGDWRQHLRPPDSALADWPQVKLDTEQAARIERGQPVPRVSDQAGMARAYGPGGEFIAILRADEQAGVWRPHKVFKDS